MPGHSAAWQMPYRALRPFSSSHLLWVLWQGVPAAQLFAAVFSKIKGLDAFDGCWALQHRWVAQRAHGIVITGAPVLVHREARELVILCVDLEMLRAVDQVDNAIDLLIGDRTKIFRCLAVAQLLRHVRQHFSKRTARQ